MSIVVAVQFAAGGGDFFSFNGEVVSYIMMAVEAGLCIYICITAAMHRKWLAFIFAIIQTPLIMWFEFTRGHGIEVESNLYIDRLSIIMILIIGII
jgi:ech hydrogenase subunit A